MKNIKYYILCLVLVLGMMGGAYAAWEEELEVEGTVNTGEVEVTIDDVAWNKIRAVPPYVNADYEYLSDDLDEIKFSIDGLYPQKQNETSFRLVNFLQNTGSIPVKLENAILDINPEGTGLPSDHEVWDHLKAKAVINWGAHDRVGSGEDKLKNIDKVIEDILEGYKFENKTGQYDHLRLIIYPWLDKNAPNELQSLEGINFSLSLNWVQWNLETQ